MNLIRDTLLYLAGHWDDMNQKVIFSFFNFNILSWCGATLRITPHEQHRSETAILDFDNWLTRSRLAFEGVLCLSECDFHTTTSPPFARCSHFEAAQLKF